MHWNVLILKDKILGFYKQLPFPLMFGPFSFRQHALPVQIVKERFLRLNRAKWRKRVHFIACK